MVTKEQLHRMIDELPEAENETAARLLQDLLSDQRAVMPGTAFFSASRSRAVLRPDVPPIEDTDELRGDFWPEDEGPDDFVEAVRTWRRDNGYA